MRISNESILVLCLMKQQTQFFILFDNFIHHISFNTVQTISIF